MALTAPPEERLRAAVARVWERAKPTTMQRVEEVEKAVAEALNDALERSARREAERTAHKLAGSLGTFGHDRASEIASEIERYLEGDDPLERSVQFRLAELVVALRTTLEKTPQAPTAPAPGDPPASERQQIVIAADNVEDATRLEVAATRAGVQAHVVTDGAPLPHADVYVIPPHRIDEVNRGAPVIVRGDPGLDDRLALVQRGVRTFLGGVSAPDMVIDVARDASRPPDRPTARIIALDDDPAILDALGALLEPPAYELVPHTNPYSFFTDVRAGGVDLAILDIDMPVMSGLDVCRLIRSDSAAARLPILFLTAHRDRDIVEQVFAAGADDYVTKPFVGSELVARVEGRLGRARVLSDLAVRDHESGLLARPAFELVAEQTLLAAQRGGDIVTVAAVALPPDESALSDVIGLLGRMTSDSWARWSQGWAAAIVREEARDEVAYRLRVLQGSAAHAGTAHLPDDGSNLTELMAAATNAALEAQARHIPAAHSGSSADATAAETVDVVLVEDDDAIARLLCETLSAQGLSVRWIERGDDAAGLLRGPDPRVRARLVVLDVNLPGLDGLAVLREMGRTKVLRRSKVLMLTARASESEVVASIELGATDHVTKPFSLPVLLHKIRRILEA